ncbi:MAG: hypothetical protein WBI07_02435 [Mobilitalea sp.]
MSDKKPIYDARANKILEMLKFKTRDEVAKEMKYKNYKSLDMYMRRKNFIFDIKAQQYVLGDKKVEKLDKDPKNYAPVKIVSIITAFEKEDVDPREVAKREGFKDHIELAEYMTNKGYEWNVYKNNYLKTVGKIVEKAEAEAPPEIHFIEAGGKVPQTLEEYIPFIRFLYEKRDDVYQLLAGTQEDGKIPRYALPGLVRTKAIYMSDMVAKLAAEFSKEKNVTQREIMEAALVEYLQKYGFKKEIDTLLKNS